MDKIRQVTNKVNNVFNFLSFGSDGNTNNDKSETVNNKEDNKTGSSRLTKYEYYIYKIQSVIIWEHRLSSFITLLLVNFLFWFFAGCSLYRLLFLTLLIWCACDAWIDHVWPEIRVPSVEQIDDWIHLHPWIFSEAEVNIYLTMIWDYLKNIAMHFYMLHTEQRSVFCILMLIGFGITHYVADTVGIYWSLYALSSMLLILPGIYLHLLPETARRCLNIIVVGIVGILMCGFDDNADVIGSDDIPYPPLDEELAAFDGDDENENGQTNVIGDEDSHGINDSPLGSADLTEEQKQKQNVSFSDSLYNVITEKLLKFGREAPRAAEIMVDEIESDYDERTDDEFEFIEKGELPDDFPLA